MPSEQPQQSPIADNSAHIARHDHTRRSQAELQEGMRLTIISSRVGHTADKF
jgi:hypothetical protein